MTTALNLCRKEHGRRARVRSGEVPERPVQLGSVTVEMRDALRELPARQREAITLFYVGDLSIHAIAEVMNISDGAVKAHLSNGRKRLRELLDG
jgi:RNA polymerase sigma-70 factor (ECF subfamily)